MRSKTSSWFECSVSYEKVQEDGTERRITEKYVVEAFFLYGSREANNRRAQELCERRTDSERHSPCPV